MRIRSDFVTNSSSSSFIINLKDITALQAQQIEHVERTCIKLEIEHDYCDGWHVSTNEENIEGYTSMDNFSMYEFLEEIGVDMDKVEWYY